MNTPSINSTYMYTAGTEKLSAGTEKQTAGIKGCFIGKIKVVNQDKR